MNVVNEAASQFLQPFLCCFYKNLYCFMYFYRCLHKELQLFAQISFFILFYLDIWIILPMQIF